MCDKQLLHRRHALLCWNAFAAVSQLSVRYRSFVQSSFTVVWDSNSPNCLQVVSQQEAVVTLSVEASQEAALEDLLDHISSKWNSVDFSLIPFKDVKDAYILGSVEDVTAALEDSMVTMSTILASR